MFETRSGKIIKELRATVAKLDHSVDVLLGEKEHRRTTGNPYPDYQMAVKELARKYEGIAEWGVQQIRNIIDVRAAFTIGQGIKLVDADNAQTGKKSREMEFAEAFIKANDLDEEGPIDLAKEAEIEGRVLAKLFYNEESKSVEYRFISYSVNGYKVETDPEDYKKYTKVTYRDPKTQKDVSIDAPLFVYKKFAGRIEKVNDVMPKLGMILRQCEDLDRALSDWRQMNKFFASPTPYFECESMNDAALMNEAIEKFNWTIGKSFAGKGKFSLVGMNDVGKDSLEKEITTNAKMISGASGVPVHFLGFPELMSNRAVSTDLFDSLLASVTKEQLVWSGFYEEMLDKAIDLQNAKGGGNLNKGKVKAILLMITAAKIQELATVWLPLYIANVIDINYMLSKIPDANPFDIKKSLSEDQQRMLDQIKKNETQPGAGGDGFGGGNGQGAGAQGGQGGQQ